MLQCTLSLICLIIEKLVSSKNFNNDTDIIFFPAIDCIRIYL